MVDKIPATGGALYARRRTLPLADNRRYWKRKEALRPSPYSGPSAEAVLAELDYTITHDSPILEIGYGVGATLAALADAGFTRLTGLELNPGAAEEARRRYPQLQGATLMTGDAAEVLQTMKDDQFRVVVAVRTLQHVHPDQAAVFDEIARIASTVMTIDEPPVLGRYRHPWDVEAELKQRGFTTRKKQSLKRDSQPTQDTVLVARRMEKQSSLHDFWRQEAPHGNQPQAYLEPIHRSAALRELIADLPGDSRILEVGCNVGRNIAYLHDNGFPNVQGIEISPHAVKLLRESYPQLADCEVHVGAAGDVLPGYQDDSLDLVYTMAVMEHLHPDEAKPVFDAMVRVAANVLAIEPENRLTHRQYPHDVVKEFTARGMEVVSITPMSDLVKDVEDKAMPYFKAYRFRRSV